MNRIRHNPKANAPALYIPCWLSQVPTKFISNSAKILYGRLAQWSDERGEVYRSAPQLSQEIGTTVRNVERYLKELRDVGLIGTFQPIAGGVNHFEFYEHEWMNSPIKEQLIYKQDNYIPPSNMSVPPVKNSGTPPSNMSVLNINKIKRNKKDISASGESPNIGYTEFDEVNAGNEKSDYPVNQAKNGKDGTQVSEKKGNFSKSDYFENQTNIQAVSKSSIPRELKMLQEENIFSIPQQPLIDWIANRKKKRLPITPTAWKKINKELARCQQHGIDPIEAFETYVANGWQSFDSEWLLKKKESRSESKNSLSSPTNFW